MRAILFSLLALLATNCDEEKHSNYYDLGNQFKHIGEPCTPDVAPNSVCGYMPPFYCSATGICASACNTNADCTDGAVCIGAADMKAGECRLPEALDGGQD